MNVDQMLIRIEQNMNELKVSIDGVQYARECLNFFRYNSYDFIFDQGRFISVFTAIHFTLITDTDSVLFRFNFKPYTDTL